MSLLTFCGYVDVFRSINVHILNRKSKLSLFLKFSPFRSEPGCTVYKHIRMFIDTIKVIYQLNLWLFLEPSCVGNPAPKRYR